MVSRISACALSFAAAASFVLVDSTVGPSVSAADFVPAAQLAAALDLAPEARHSLEPGFEAVVVDRFDRTLRRSLGSADSGGKWTLGGKRSSFSVSGERGHLASAEARAAGQMRI